MVQYHPIGPPILLQSAFNNGLIIQYWHSSHKITVSAGSSVIVESTPPIARNIVSGRSISICPSSNSIFLNWYGPTQNPGNVGTRINSTKEKTNDTVSIYYIWICKN